MREPAGVRWTGISKENDSFHPYQDYSVWTQWDTVGIGVVSTKVGHSRDQREEVEYYLKVATGVNHLHHLRMAIV